MNTRTDDTEAQQRAIDEHDVVLLLKGTYCVSRALKLRENTLMIGLRQMSTIANSLFKAARMTIEGTNEPLRIYQSNPEWGNRPHMLIHNASDLTVYGLKEEGPRSIAIIDSDRICVYG